MSPAEARQCVGDITSWFAKKLDGELRGTNVAELERLSKSLDMELPVVFEELYKKTDGVIWMYEYQTLALQQISKLAAEINDGKSKLLPFARDLNDDLLVIDVNDECVKEYSDGVGDTVAQSFTAFCEKFRNDLLSGKCAHFCARALVTHADGACPRPNLSQANSILPRRAVSWKLLLALRERTRRARRSSPGPSPVSPELALGARPCARRSWLGPQNWPPAGQQGTQAGRQW